MIRTEGDKDFTGKLRQNAKRQGVGKVKKTLHIAVFLHENREVNHRGWIVGLEDRSVVALTTNQDSLYRWEVEEAESAIAQTEANLASLKSIANQEKRAA
jgi:hypothetical protein